MQKPMWPHKTIGDRGEEVACRYLYQEKKLVLHENDNCDSHVVDYFCDNRNGKYFFAEVKTKNEFNNGTREFGFESTYYKKYVELIENPPTDIVMVFINLTDGVIYKQSFKHLMDHKRDGQLPDRTSWGKQEKKYNDVVFFPLSQMIADRRLTPEELRYIKNVDCNSRATDTKA